MFGRNPQDQSLLLMRFLPWFGEGMFKRVARLTTKGLDIVLVGKNAVGEFNLLEALLLTTLNLHTAGSSRAVDVSLQLTRTARLTLSKHPEHTMRITFCQFHSKQFRRRLERLGGQTSKV